MDLWRRMVGQGLFQSDLDQLFGQAAAQVPAANAAGKQIHQHSQVTPLGGQPDVGDVATPNLIGMAGDEPFDQVGIGSQTPG